MPIQVTCPSCSSMFNAPDNAAGKTAKCPKCGGAIVIPTPVVEEEEILDAELAEDEPASIYDEDEFEVEPPVALPKVDDRKPCPMCGEMIQKNAVKCRHCGEVFDPLLRAQEMKRAGGADSELTTLDWVLCILCSNIACILGIIWMVQGKPKGSKMILIAICANIGWFVIGALLGALQEM